jgi:hypothetical protein
VRDRAGEGESYQPGGAVQDRPAARLSANLPTLAAARASAAVNGVSTADLVAPAYLACRPATDASCRAHIRPGGRLRGASPDCDPRGTATASGAGYAAGVRPHLGRRANAAVDVADSPHGVNRASIRLRSASAVCALAARSGRVRRPNQRRAVLPRTCVAQFCPLISFDALPAPARCVGVVCGGVWGVRHRGLSALGLGVNGVSIRAAQGVPLTWFVPALDCGARHGAVRVAAWSARRRVTAGTSVSCAGERISRPCARFAGAAGS